LSYTPALGSGKCSQCTLPVNDFVGNLVGPSTAGRRVGSGGVWQWDHARQATDRQNPPHGTPRQDRPAEADEEADDGQGGTSDENSQANPMNPALWLGLVCLWIGSPLLGADPKDSTPPPSQAPSATAATKAAAPSPWPGGREDRWHGFVRHRFTVEGATGWVVEPRQAAPGKPWTWCLEFPDAFTERTGVLQLLEQGFHHVHLEVGNTFGSPRALEQFDAFYEALRRGGLGPKAALVGISRGGLYAYRWAARHPQRVACIYGDAPACDFKSWPGGKGSGKGSPGDWAQLQRHYGFATEAEALAFTGNPVDQLAPLAKAGVRLIHVVGDTDDVVPVAENTAVVESRYRALGGRIEVIHKPGVGHHPHGLDDPAPAVTFIRESFGNR